MGTAFANPLLAILTRGPDHILYVHEALPPQVIADLLGWKRQALSYSFFRVMRHATARTAQSPHAVCRGKPAVCLAGMCSEDLTWVIFASLLSSEHSLRRACRIFALEL